MTSERTILTFFIYKVPILRLNTSNTTSLELIRSLFRANASVLIVTVNMRTLAFHTFPGFSDPKTRRITFNTNII